VKRICSIFAMLVALSLLAACAGRFDYVRPVAVEAPLHWLVVAKSRDDVWRQASASPIQDGFVVNAVDKDTGVITLTYSGNPERYVDCGYITSYVKNVRGERRYQFAASTASTEYELMTGREIVSIARRMTLDARIAVTVIPMGDKDTRISATARYVLSRTMLIRDTQGGARTISHRINFTSDQEGAFPGAVVCRASGMLETDALSALTS
jgi:hypothetical protein